MTTVIGRVICAGVTLLGLSGPVLAQSEVLKNPIAIFSGLDKITGVITTFEVQIDQTKRFGALNVRPRVCNSRPATESPKTTSFIEVDESQLDGSVKRIFTGWMLAESPGLNAVEHPVYDIWLTGCRDPNRVDEFAPLPDNGTADAPVDPEVSDGQ